MSHSVVLQSAGLDTTCLVDHMPLQSFQRVFLTNEENSHLSSLVSCEGPRFCVHEAPAVYYETVRKASLAG